MTIYAIGDIQGCYQELMRLLDQVAFDPHHDVLWSVGDLVNRGPDSLSVLRFFKNLGDHAVVVLGNHDLHLLALAAGSIKHSKQHTLHAILQAPDRHELLDWLRQCPLLYYDEATALTLVHAGLSPHWTHDQAQACAAELESVLRRSDYGKVLKHLYGNEPSTWRDQLQGIERWRYITNALTRMRYCDQHGRLLLKEKRLPTAIDDPTIVPWFRLPWRRNREYAIIFGHWSTLGYQHEHHIWALDSGCLWGGCLTLLEITDQFPTSFRTFSVDCPGYVAPNTVN
jgi:bis(5'-nucleosyl)-tetraphosphatase (symmetrical)